MAIVYKDNPHWWKKYAFVGLGLIGSFVLAGVATALILQHDLPSPAQLNNIQPRLITRIYDRNGAVLMEYYTERRILIPYSEIPPYLIDCLLATEDRKFYDHWGVDVRRIFGALAHNIIKLDLTAEGASTLSQQLSRSLFLTPQKTLTRKIKEALTSIRIERTYSKNEIIQMYLNHHYFGPRAYGIQAASQLYFGKNAQELTLLESALLIGLLKAPSRYNPLEHPERALERRNIVLNSLVDFGKITRETADSLKQLPLQLNHEKNNIGKAPYFTELVRQKILNDYGEDALYSSGMSIYTTLDLGLQTVADSAVDREVDEQQAAHERYYKITNPDYTYLIPDTLGGPDSIRVYKQIQGMLFAMDNKTGATLAFVGGRDFKESKFNRVVQALRQPGSAFKPIVYATAIDNGFSPSDLMLDSPIVLNIGGEEWRPSNFDNTFKGEMTLRDGLRASRNLIAVKLIMDPLVTPRHVVEYARRLGITTPLDPVPSLAMGSSDVLLWELVPAFSVFPNGGILRKPYYISKIVDRNGYVLYQKNMADQEEVLSEQTSYIMTSMLETVIDHGTGIGARLRGFTRPAGGKTGTTNDFTNNWFIGFVPQITCGAWIGFDDYTRIGSPSKGEVGASTALPVWTEFMKAACDSLPAKDFPIPPGIYTATVCLDSGDLAKGDCVRTVTDLFTEETLPKQECPIDHLAEKSKKENEKRFRIDDENAGKKTRF